MTMVSSSRGAEVVKPKDSSHPRQDKEDNELLADSSCNLLLLVAAKKELFSACKESPRDTFAIFMFGIPLIIAH